MTDTKKERRRLTTDNRLTLIGRIVALINENPSMTVNSACTKLNAEGYAKAGGKKLDSNYCLGLLSSARLMGQTLRAPIYVSSHGKGRILFTRKYGKPRARRPKAPPKILWSGTLNFGMTHVVLGLLLIAAILLAVTNRAHAVTSNRHAEIIPLPAQKILGIGETT